MSGLEYIYVVLFGVAAPAGQLKTFMLMMIATEGG